MQLSGDTLANKIKACGFDSHMYHYSIIILYISSKILWEIYGRGREDKESVGGIESGEVSGRDVGREGIERGEGCAWRKGCDEGEKRARKGRETEDDSGMKGGENNRGQRRGKSEHG